MASVPRELWGDLAATAFVEASPLFRSLDAEALRDLLQLAHRVDYAPGELASPEGDESFLLVLDGSASVQAGVAEVAHLERGATFGEGRVLGAGRALALVACTELAVVSFPAPMVGALAERFPKMKKLLEAVLAAREREASARISS